MNFKPREKQDQFFWSVNDLIKEARPGYAGPATYEEWLSDNPNRTIQAWFNEEAERYIERQQLEADWRGFHHNASEDALDKACQHCYENILKDTLVVVEDKQAAAFADAVREVLPKQPLPVVDIASYPSWLDYTQAVEVIQNLSGKSYERDSIRKLVQREKLTAHPHLAGRVSRESCLAFAGNLRKS